MATIWLLDVDGVINATKSGWSSAPFSGTAYSKYTKQSYRIRWAPQLIKRINKLHATGGVLIFWATSWAGDTDVLEDLFKLPTLFSAGSKAMSGSDKRRAAWDVLNSGNRLIWTDDEFTPVFGNDYDEMLKTGRALLIRPKANKGLRPEHLDAIDNFVLG